ncbi:MAG: NAD-dependent deacylase [Vulcanimicrobiaceae bacterium]
MDDLIERLRAAHSVMVLSGSGISAESGLPTFRGVGGLWRTHRVEELASPEGFARDPQLVWTWYNERREAHKKAQPNAGHLAIAQMEKRFADFTLATQNVDSLHLRAGSRKVLELHGNLREARCTHCKGRRTIENGLPLDEISHNCGGMYRPDIVWFGEGLDPVIWAAAVDAAVRAQVLLVVGTSGMVNPAAALAVRFARGAYIVEINPEETVVSAHCDLTLREPAASALPRITGRLLKEKDPHRRVF